MHAASSRLSFGGVPSFFRACCWTARGGGDVGYDHPGRELARHVESLDPYDATPDAWAAEIERLRVLVEQRDDRAVITWFVEHYPRCLSLVPKRRREAFLRGAYSMLAE